MLDTGLLFTGATMWLVVAAAARWAPVSVIDRKDVLDRLIVPSLVGLVAGRLAAVILDDPTSLGSVRSLLVIRSGVEFWPGVAAALALLMWGLRRERAHVSIALAELAPFLLWGYAAYEATCLVRDGCYGPVSSIGVVPQGLRIRMFPVGLVAALAVMVLGFAVRHLRAWSPTAKVLLALGGVATARSVASIWLPRLGDGPTRQHLESVVVGLLVLAVVAATTITGARTRAHGKADDAPVPTPAAPVVPPTERRRS